jgi:bifunctional DNase/RNase
MRDMLLAEIWSIAQTNQGNAVLLRPQGMEIAVPIFIGQLEMQSILIGREGVTLPRPLTHDLFLNMLGRVNLAIKRVEVYELKDNTFHARLIITGGEYTNEKPLVLDSRPSDAFALAVRRRYPIFIAATVVEQAGIPLDFFMEAMEEAGESAAVYIPNPGVLQDDRETGGTSVGKYQTLLDQLNRAVAEEEYERAAEIRDLLRLMDDKDIENGKSV